MSRLQCDRAAAGPRNVGAISRRATPQLHWWPMITVGRGRWVAIGLLAAHELMLHSGYGNTMLYQQGGLFGQDYVQDFMNSAARPLVQIASRLDAPQAMTQLALLTVRHDRRVVDFLAEQLHPSTFQRIATRPGGLHVIKNMTQSATADRERVRHVLQSAGVLDVLAQTVISATRPAVQAAARSDKRAGFQYFSSANTSLDILADLMLHTGLLRDLDTDFDRCFQNGEQIRRSLRGGLPPAESLLHVMQENSLTRNSLTRAKQSESALARLHRAKGHDVPSAPSKRRQATIELSPAVAFVFGRFMSATLGALCSGIGYNIAISLGKRLHVLKRISIMGLVASSCAWVLWNDLFISWHVFFDRTTFPTFDRRTRRGRQMDALWSQLCQSVHFLGNCALVAWFPAGFIPYAAISAHHFFVEIDLLRRAVFATTGRRTPF